MKNKLLVNSEETFQEIVKRRGVPRGNMTGKIILSPESQERLRKKLKANDEFRRKSLERGGHKVIW